MLFNSLTFWVFFPCFYGLYFALRGKSRLALCLVGSYLFYGWWDWRFLALIFALTTINYWCGIKISESKIEKHKKHYVSFSIFCSLIILIYFKYFNFFIDSAADILAILGFQSNWSTLSIILPVGISFYTFQAMSYTIDLYRKEVGVERSFLKFAVFISFFPQLVAGPVVRASNFLPQLQTDQKVSFEDLRVGLNQVLWGFVLKVVIADNLAPVVDPAFADPTARSGLYLLVATFFYAFQIYGDFAGYSLIAIGLARMMGFKFPQNFDRPYFATSFSEFWKRWHISLSSWLRDYLYIPLGGNRQGPRRTQINLMLTMLLGGLWHGAAWGFILWGGLHGLYLIAQRYTFLESSENLRGWRRMLCALLVFTLVCLSWIFFRAHSISDGMIVLEKIITLDGWSFASILKKFYFIKGCLLIMALVIIEASSFKINFDAYGKQSLLLNGAFKCICLVLIAGLGMFDGGAFIYFQF